VADAHASVVSTAVSVGYGEEAHGKRAGKVSKFCSRIGGAISGANSAAQNLHSPSATPQ